MKLNLLASALGLFGLVAHTAALPHARAELEVVALEDNDTQGTVRFMPLGASIVEITCWRAFLWKKLLDANVTNLDFVGSSNGPATCTLNGQTVTFDKDNEGHSGAKATEYAANGNLPGWLSSAKPDVLLMHLGTNDITGNISIADIIKAYDILLQQMREQKADMTIIISKLIPLDPDKFNKTYVDNVNVLNKAIEAWVSQNDLLLVDPNTGFNTKTMTDDGEHPNEKGSVFMADKYFKVVQSALQYSEYLRCRDIDQCQ